MERDRIHRMGVPRPEKKGRETPKLFEWEGGLGCEGSTGTATLRSVLMQHSSHPQPHKGSFSLLQLPYVR